MVYLFRALLAKLLSQRETIPLERIISKRVQHYRGIPDWEAWQIVKRPDWC